MEQSIIDNWGSTPRTVTMTNEEWNSLYCYLISTTHHAEGERDAWRSMAQEKNADGSPKFPNAESNAVWYQGVCDKLALWLAKIDGKEA